MRTPSRPLGTFGGAMLVLVALVALLAGCNGDEAEVIAATPTPTPTPTPEPTPTPTEPEAIGHAPLTGVALYEDEEEVLERAVVAVKVDNAPAARPQTGLDLADIVFEELVEGGATRFIALFQSQVPPTVGPIRSARPEDAAVLPPYGGMFFHSGGRAETIAALRSSGLVWSGEDRSVMHRQGGRRAPHNLYGDGEAMFARAFDRLGAAEAAAWEFDEDVPLGAVDCPAPCDEHPGEAIDVRMSAAYTTGFTYDEEEGVYRRSQNGAPHTVTGEERIGASNVVVLGMQVGPGGCCDAAGNPYTVTRIGGEGPAVVLRDGERFAVRWSKAGPAEHLLLTTDEGAPFTLRPGPSWVLLAPVAALP